MELIRMSEVLAKTPDPTSEEREKLFPCYYSHWCPFHIAKYHLSLRDTVVLAHAPQGCVGAERAFLSSYMTQYFGQPFIYTPCTDMRDADVIIGGREKLREAILEVDQLYRPKVIFILYSCVTGMIKDPIPEVAEEVGGQIGARIVIINGMGVDHSSAARINMHVASQMAKLIKPPSKKDKGGVNILGLTKEIFHVGNFTHDAHEYQRLLEKLGLHCHSVLMQGATVEDLESAAEAEFNAIDCPTWGYPLAKHMQEQFGVPYGRRFEPLGVSATSDWLMEVASHFGLESKAQEVIDKEYEAIKGVWEKARGLVSGKIALIDGGDPMSNSGRAIVWSRLCADLGMRPIIYNIPPMEFKGRVHHNTYALDNGIDPEVIWADYAHHRRLSPTSILRFLGATNQDVGVYIGDVYPRAMAKDGEPVFDPANAPRVVTCSHMSRKKYKPGRRVGFRGAEGFALDIINAIGMARKGFKPSLAGRLGAAR